MHVQPNKKYNISDMRSRCETPMAKLIQLYILIAVQSDHIKND